jgi:hypothetical protein
MMTSRKILVTSALPYANGEIHLGHLLEYIVSSNALDSLEINGDKVTVNILLNYPAQSYHQTLTDAITNALSTADIKDGSFTVDDIGIANGTIHSDSFTKVSETQYTVIVTPSLGGKHSNVAIKLNVIVLAAVFLPPLPVIIRVGLTASSTKLPLAIKLVNKSVV